MPVGSRPGRLAAGPLTLELDGPDIRDVRLDGFELVRRLHVTLRGPDWETFEPKLSEESLAASCLFLGNIQPDLQRQVRAQCQRASFVALDSMNLWIDIAKDALLAAIAEVDCVVLNDAEARQLTGQTSLAKAARAIRELGPSIVVAKQGEYGACLFTDDTFFSLPGYPLEEVLDPTGAGDTFAGGFLGYLDAHAGEPLSGDLLKRAMTYGSVIASFNVEDFGTERVQRLTQDEVDARFADFKRFTHFEAIPFRR